jgi:hypothetical protein
MSAQPYPQRFLVLEPCEGGAAEPHGEPLSAPAGLGDDAEGSGVVDVESLIAQVRAAWLQLYAFCSTLFGGNVDLPPCRRTLATRSCVVRPTGLCRADGARGLSTGRATRAVHALTGPSLPGPRAAQLTELLMALVPQRRFAAAVRAALSPLSATLLPYMQASARAPVLPCLRLRGSLR